MSSRRTGQQKRVRTLGRRFGKDHLGELLGLPHGEGTSIEDELRELHLLVVQDDLREPI
jgi:hypothetical protein